MSDRFDVLVLRRGTHGMPVADLANEIRKRLPDHDVRVATTPREERELIREAPVAVGMGIDEELLSQAEELELFACAYAGTGHLPMDALEEAGVAVTNAAGVHGPNIAEQVLGSILAFTRRFFEGRDRQRDREWRHYQTDEFLGSTVTVVGLGAIGESIVERLEGFGVETIGVRYTPEKGGPTDEVIGFEEEPLHDALSRTDVLVLACPLTDTTRGLIGEEELVTLPEDALLINIARGPVVETEALVDAIRRNKLRGAALDVTDPEPLPEDHPLWGFDNVQITPHNAGHTPEYYTRLADIVAENVERLDAGEQELKNQVV
ncbi:D-2-hydroxyacid dehydrogenase [Halalkalicoccus sp. GCM10025322]|uniref:D-2-hydroxyacid dehydrogenase n=1 Tax=Halalkalicoccus TaxID=332246 RepID=UPI002F96DCD7